MDSSGTLSAFLFPLFSSPLSLFSLSRTGYDRFQQMARLSVEENGWDLPDELKNQRILLVQMEKVVTESMERTSANKDDNVAKFVRLRNYFKDINSPVTCISEYTDMYKAKKLMKKFFYKLIFVMKIK